MAGAVDVAAAADPAGAVLAAHRAGRRIVLTTSGTAGRPRRIVRTTASWFDSFPVVARLTGLDASSRMWLPGRAPDGPGRVGHGSTLSLFAEVLARHTGAACVARPEDATHAHLTPGQLERSLDGLAAARASHPVHVTVAGEALPGALRERAEAAGLRVSRYYGAAELSFVAWAVGDAGLRPFPGVEVDVRDGEVWARSPYLSDGYAGGTPQTDDAGGTLRTHAAGGTMRTDAAGGTEADMDTDTHTDTGGALRTAPDGFATVGDRGRWETERAADGGGRVLVVTGRGDDAVTTAAATVLVADVEAALRPVVTGAFAVLGLPHTSLGQVLAAVLTNPSDLEPAQAAARGLTAAQRPRLWFLRDGLPVAASGKTDRAALRREAAALHASAPDTSAPDPSAPDGGNRPLRRLVPERAR
ncbi:long-chain fatty acid--CoA ligase [Nocardioides sp. HDW12B]|uniref:long-chain fatty acid--CoA ligase n=1 Tax=Nocardioides sp. HDW12B TaxID=2714939 RepID=UPI0014090877|nr:long-chain fatty acid--CoA ligase [Nocardioides sp. HDW12B]QIK67179.1 long-chain fatty acid--CoA ligase [Nocardioides sp. HDW12B]